MKFCLCIDINKLLAPGKHQHFSSVLYHVVGIMQCLLCFYAPKIVSNLSVLPFICKSVMHTLLAEYLIAVRATALKLAYVELSNIFACKIVFILLSIELNKCFGGSKEPSH